MGLLAIVDQLRDELPVPDGVTRDATGHRPARFDAGRLYVWPVSDARKPEGDGSIDKSAFSLGLALTLATDEASEEVRERAISVALDDAGDAIAAWVRDHRADELLWDNLQVDAYDYAALHGLEHRGITMEISGEREVMS